MIDGRNLANRAIGSGQMTSRAPVVNGEAIPVMRCLDDGTQIWAVAKPAADQVAMHVRDIQGDTRVLELSRAEARAIRDSLTDALDDFDRAADMAGGAA